jgi:hypothetical protein
MIYHAVGLNVDRVTDTIDQIRVFETLSTETLINVESPTVIRESGTLSIFI